MNKGIRISERVSIALHKLLKIVITALAPSLLFFVVMCIGTHGAILDLYKSTSIETILPQEMLFFFPFIACCNLFLYVYLNFHNLIDSSEGYEFDFRVSIVKVILHYIFYKIQFIGVYYLYCALVSIYA